MHFSTNQLLLYRLFLSYPNRAFYMQEIGRILNKKPGVFQRTLNKLEVDGFVQSEFQANARFFRLNKSYPLLKEVLSIIKKTSKDINIFKDRIQQLKTKTKKTKPLKTVKKKQKKPKIPADDKKEIRDKPFPTRLIDLHDEKPLTSLVPDYSKEVPEEEEKEPELKPQKPVEPVFSKPLKKKENEQKAASKPQTQLELF